MLQEPRKTDAPETDLIRSCFKEPQEPRREKERHSLALSSAVHLNDRLLEEWTTCGVCAAMLEAYSGSGPESKVSRLAGADVLGPSPVMGTLGGEAGLDLSLATSMDSGETPLQGHPSLRVPQMQNPTFLREAVPPLPYQDLAPLTSFVLAHPHPCDL
ncbi:hypothetical protein CB1_001095027 [Camelus ferus]|nr:hypothetical protein CB1_001095027 [Camelus ferus]